MRRKRRPVKLLIIGIGSLLLLLYLLITQSPQSTIAAGSVQISTVFLFFVLLPITLFSLISYIFRSRLHGILIALLVCSYLLFRLNELTHPFFLLLLLAIFLTLELLFARPKQ